MTANFRNLLSNLTPRESLDLIGDMADTHPLRKDLWDRIVKSFEDGYQIMLDHAYSKGDPGIVYIHIGTEKTPDASDNLPITFFWVTPGITAAMSRCKRQKSISVIIS